MYDLDYLPKLMERVNNLIVDGVLSPKQTEAMKLVLFNLYKFRSKACCDLAQTLTVLYQKEKIEDKDFVNLQKFLRVENKRCARFLWLLTQNKVKKESQKDITI